MQAKLIMPMKAYGTHFHETQTEFIKSSIKIVSRKKETDSIIFFFFFASGLLSTLEFLSSYLCVCVHAVCMCYFVLAQLL